MSFCEKIRQEVLISNYGDVPVEGDFYVSSNDLLYTLYKNFFFKVITTYHGSYTQYLVRSETIRRYEDEDLTVALLKFQSRDCSIQAYRTLAWKGSVQSAINENLICVMKGGYQRAVRKLTTDIIPKKVFHSLLD